MARLRIYMHDSGDCVLHRSGFSWLAAFALPVWAFSKGLYRTALLALVAVVTASQLTPLLLDRIASETLSGLIALAYVLAYWMVPGFYATRWHRRVLERSGYFVSADEEISTGTGR